MINGKLIGKGKRSFVYSVKLNNRMVAVKIQREDTAAQNICEKEYRVLKELNRHNIGPKVIKLKQNMLFMEHIEGERITEFINKKGREEILKIFEKLLKKLRKLDILGYSKKELTNPHKHIIISSGEPRLIDFERCTKTEKPNNITQFISFLTKSNIAETLLKKRIFLNKKRLRLLSARYKRSQSDKCFKAILRHVCQQEFSQRVYCVTALIPEGKVATYKQIADCLNTRGYRAVGNALNKNPYSPFLPCHRVIPSSGELGNFSKGIAKKLELLKKEGVEIKNNRIDKRFIVAGIDSCDSC